MSGSPFHAGERAAQRWAAVPASNGSFIRSFLPDAHREFLEKLPFLLVGSVDDTLQPSASLLAGQPGFVRTQPDVLEVHATVHAGDPLIRNLRRGTRLGILGLEPHTRRRNRVNGYVLDVKANHFTLLVEQSFGNCPKYITPRTLEYAPAPRTSATPNSALTAYERQFMCRADTFFVASAHPNVLGSDDPSHGVDVSHRGGPPGFVRFIDDSTFAISDFKGNNLFNTFGNILLNPRVGLLFWDIDGQRVLQVSGRAELKSTTSSIVSASEVSQERSVEFCCEEVRWLDGACALRQVSA